MESSDGPSASREVLFFYCIINCIANGLIEKADSEIICLILAKKKYIGIDNFSLVIVRRYTWSHSRADQSQTCHLDRNNGNGGMQLIFI